MAVTKIPKANSPYMGAFRMTQTQHSNHDGYDLVGLDSKEIHATFTGKVKYAGWENASNHAQGFGQYVCIEFFYAPMSKTLYAYFGHLSVIKVKTGQSVKVTEVIGIEGSTGNSTGSHCHYCIRPQFSQGNALSLASISGIPNALGDYDDCYRQGSSTNTSTTTTPAKKTIEVELKQNGVTYAGTLTEK